MKNIAFVIFLLITACNTEKPTEFSEIALNDKVLSTDGNALKLKDVLEKFKGDKIFVDVWASWCSDCIKSLPNIKKMQKKYSDIVFLFLSVDTNFNSWNKGIAKHNIKGVHYNFPKGMKKGDFVDFVHLNWIPRYMVVDEAGKILLFKSTNTFDPAIEEALNFVQ